MDRTNPQRTTLKLLVLSDIDVQSAYLLSEKFVPRDPMFDCVLCCGPLGDSDYEIRQAASDLETLKISNISSALAALENIVCRVVYIPSEGDPPKIFLEQMHLTPNSVNVYARRLALVDGLFVTGYSEIGQARVIDGASTAGGDEDANETETDWSEIAAEGDDPSHSISPAELDISDILSIGTKKAQDTLLLMAESTGASSTLDAIMPELQRMRGIFALNFVYAHTLNQFLFHKAEALKAAGISICIVNNTSKDGQEQPPNEALRTRMPSKLGDLSIILPHSLRRERKFLVVDLALVGGIWQLKHVKSDNL